MIRLRFIDKYCNNLQELKDFLSAHAGEEKNRYHESVANQFRAGLIKQWLIQEKAYSAGKDNEDEAGLLQSLVNAVTEVEGKLESDREIFSWMLRVFCSETNVLPSLNPLRYIDVKKVVIFYNREGKYFSGCINYEIIVPANETFTLKLSIDGKECELIDLAAYESKGIEYIREFKAHSEQTLNGKNITDVKIILDGYPIPANCTFICIETNFENYYIVSAGEGVFISRKDNSRFFVSSGSKQIKRIEDINQNGVVCARSGEEDKYFLDIDGRELAQVFTKIKLVGDGLAAIWTNKGSVVFVTADGNERFETEQLTEVSVFSEGYLAVRRASNGDWAYLRKDGTIIGSYAIAGDFQYGLARVFRKEWSGNKWYSIDKNFHEIGISVPTEAIRPSTCPDRLNGMYIKEHNGGWGLFTDDGYPVPITFNLPDINEKLLFEL